MKCSFCDSNIKTGTGKIYVRSDGSLLYWCSSKCEKNYELGRKSKKLKWIERK